MSTRAQWMAIIGGFLALVLVAVIISTIFSAATRQSYEDAEQASSSEAQPEEPTEEPTEEESAREVVAEETFESFEVQEDAKASRPEPRTPEERIRRNVEDVPMLGTKKVWVDFYDDNGCLDVVVTYRTSEPLFGILTQAETTESEMESIYEAIHGDREAHGALCDATVAAFGDSEADLGQKTDENLYQTTITRDKASRVNWFNTGDVNFYAVWRVDHIHPDVREEEDENDRTVLDCAHDPDLMRAIGGDCNVAVV